MTAPGLLLGLQAALTAMDGTPATKATAVVFYSTVCPVANDYNQRLALLWKEFGARRDVKFLVVYPNKTESLEEVRAHAAAMRFPFPVYRDDGNVLADRVGAHVTPTAAVLAPGGTIRYLGPIDDAVNPARVKKRYLRDAIRATLGGRAAQAATQEPYG